jgi:4-amino-4-deoxy-L-arabinose transferase-like glycosyltransferase
MIEATQTSPTERLVAVKPGQSHWWVWCVLGLVLLGTALIRLRLLEMPLERDEGEYAYAGQLMLQGIPPYKLAYNMKFPGTYVAYAAIMAVFGQTTAGIHTGFLLVNAATIVLVFLLARRLAGNGAGVASAALYGYLSLSGEVLGTSAHATHFVMLSALAGLWVLLEAVERRSIWRLFVSGIFLGLAVLMKQHGAVFAVFSLSYLGYQRLKPLDLKRFGLEGTSLTAGVLCPLVIAGLWLWKAGVFGKFWFWTIQYGSQYAAARPGLARIFENLVGGMPRELYAVLYLAAFGGVMLARAGKRAEAYFGLGLLAFSLVAIFPNFVFRPHYFVLVLPAASLLAGAAIARAWEYLDARGQIRPAAVLVAAFIVVLGLGVYHERELFFLRAPDAASRLIYHNESAFPEAVGVAKYLKDHTSPDESIAVLGSEPEIYFYAQRHSATGYIYTYALMEPQPYAAQMQEEMIREIESAKPKYVVKVHDIDSWAKQADSVTRIFDWYLAYLKTDFERVGLVETFTNRAEIRWDEEAKGRRPQADVYFEVFRRKNG